MVKNEPSKMSFAHLPTPLDLLERFSASLGGPRIWIKRDDLTHTLMSGNKLRKLEFVVADALERGANVLVTCGGVQSNHCRATAILCAQLGLRCHLILRGRKPNTLDGNLLLAHLAGAEISYLEPQDYSSSLASVFESVCEKYKQSGLVAYPIPTGASDETGLWGYYRAAKELLADFDKKDLSVGMVCCATGSGGTHAGLALGFHHAGFAGDVRGYAVCDDRDYFLQKGLADINAWYQKYFPNELPDIPCLDVNDRFIGSGYGIASSEVMTTIADLARVEGVFLDPVYTGKAFNGLCQQIKSGELDSAQDVVFVHTGGVFGLYPFREQLSD